ncbi:Eukaryotic/viral aspartic protease [Phytophthora megakarya]|uniref:Eukaryotic/viral aspartic protease n=1 Tax=Phytophthora megakarya TaxID=4795 RepID=A0A225VAM2_9STRA|nr:Eukaryotic/viral aspartic protease [Phytophthora megakarya]
MSATTRVKANATPGWNTVYEFWFWVMDHSAGSEVVLGTGFRIPAGIRLDLADDDTIEVMHVTGGPTENLQLPAGEWVEFRLQNRKPSFGTHDVWVRRTAALIPTIIRFRKGRSTQGGVLSGTFLFDSLGTPRFMPKQAGYVPIDSRKYEQ